jgi:hypothetical protein
MRVEAYTDKQGQIRLRRWIDRHILWQAMQRDGRYLLVTLHKDERIEGILFINMLALLAYSLLERQVRQGRLQVTTRRIIERLESLDVIETACWDGVTCTAPSLSIRNKLCCWRSRLASWPIYGCPLGPISSFLPGISCS